MKGKESLRNCHSLEETKGTHQPNALWNSGLDPGAEKRTLVGKKQYNMSKAIV